MKTPNILSLYMDTITERGRTLAAANRHLLGLSVTLMTLLLPLSLFSTLSFASRLILSAVVLFLLGSEVLSLLCQIRLVKDMESKVDETKHEAKRQLVEGQPPRAIWGKQKYATLSFLFSTASICFGLALLALSGVVFQILLS